MKNILLITLLLIGCTEKSVDFYVDLEEKEGLFYNKNSNNPYTGNTFTLDEDGLKYFEGNLIDGLMDGLWIWYYKNGNKESQRNYKNGELEGVKTEWYESGNKKSEVKYDNGYRDGLDIVWHNNGQKKSEAEYSYASQIFKKCWDIDGNEEDCN